MEIKTVYAVYFSATGRTRKVVTTLANAIAQTLELPLETVDFTLPAAREETYAFTDKDLVIFGTPTYAGKVPNKLLPFVQTGFAGNGALAVPVVTFGNRSFDNSLAELCASLENVARRNRTTPFHWSWAIPLISVFLSMADFAYLYALRDPEAMISVVSMIRRGSVVVSFLCGALLFRERNLRSKAVDLAFILVGMIFLWLGSRA